MSRRSEPESPSAFSVYGGGFFAALCGALVSAVLLAITPPQDVREMPAPEERVPGAVYYVQGSEAGGGGWENVRAGLLEEGLRQPVRLSEGDLNQWARKHLRPEKQPADGEAFFGLVPQAGVPNFRLREDSLQLSTVLEVPRLAGKKIVCQATGQMSGGSFQPEKVYLGSCPVPPVPVLPGLLVGLLRGGYGNLDEGIALQNAWAGLADARVEDGVLLLQP